MHPSAPVDAIHPTSASRQPEPMIGGNTAAIGGDPLGQSMNLMGATMVYPRNTEIFGENEPADYLYKVVSGSVRTYKILSDGRRQVGGFYLPGDLFGLEFADEHTLSAEAISDAKVLVVKRSALTALAGHDALVAQQLFNLTGRELRRVQDRILLLVKSAQERVASFLLEMAERVSGNSIDLPMSRQDIADYLGLTIETVSRTLTSLECAAAIEVPTSRRIVLRNRPALSRMNG
jgi:CRP/FNR family transcriptional regulator, nitrogen fixation regulation protein